MLCKKCGAEQPDGTVNCIFCGAVLSEEVAQEEETAPKEDTVEEEIYDENERKRREQIEQMMAEKQKQLSEIEKRRNSKKQKQKRNRVIAVSLIAAAVAAGSGIGAFYVKNEIDRRNNEVTPSPLPIATANATEAVATPSPDPSASPDAIATVAPQQETTKASDHSWSSTGNTGSGASSSGTGTSSSSGASSGSSSSGNSSASNASSGKSSSASSSGGGASSGASNAVSNTGISTSPINSGLAKGGEVIYNQSTGRYLMTFVIDNKKYYANVSAGSTTEQISGKYMTINAAPTGETYNGNTVYEISSLTNYSADGYIIKDSGTRLITENDIAGFTKDKLALARNEIYARHGRKFTMDVYREYFSKCPWYSINPNYNYADDNSNLNSTEIQNVAFLLKAENSR